MWLNPATSTIFHLWMFIVMMWCTIWFYISQCDFLTMLHFLQLQLCLNSNFIDHIVTFYLASWLYITIAAICQCLTMCLNHDFISCDCNFYLKVWLYTIHNINISQLWLCDAMLLFILQLQLYHNCNFLSHIASLLCKVSIYFIIYIPKCHYIPQWRKLRL